MCTPCQPSFIFAEQSAASSSMLARQSESASRLAAALTFTAEYPPPRTRHAVRCSAAHSTLSRVSSCPKRCIPNLSNAVRAHRRSMSGRKPKGKKKPWEHGCEAVHGKRLKGCCAMQNIEAQRSPSLATTLTRSPSDAGLPMLQQQHSTQFVTQVSLVRCGK